VTIDWEKRNWRRILTPEEEREIAAKMLRLNGGPDYNPDIERLLAAASSKKKKPTFRIKTSRSKLKDGSIPAPAANNQSLSAPLRCLVTGLYHWTPEEHLASCEICRRAYRPQNSNRETEKLKGASSLQMEREKAEKALRLNGF
jgi:hypothetical protein